MSLQQELSPISFVSQSWHKGSDASTFSTFYSRTKILYRIKCCISKTKYPFFLIPQLLGAHKAKHFEDSMNDINFIWLTSWTRAAHLHIIWQENFVFKRHNFSFQRLHCSYMFGLLIKAHTVNAYNTKATLGLRAQLGARRYPIKHRTLDYTPSTAHTTT